MLDNDYAKVGDLSIDVEDAAQAAGEAYAPMSEAQRYSEKLDKAQAFLGQLVVLP